jgi:TPP-dependent pyruvate/acetoin dehydrogenase alpha subunit
MFTSATLTPEQFTILHNHLCTLQFSSDEKVHDIVEDIRNRVLADAYKADNEEFDNKFDLYSAVAEENGFESTWSIYEVEDFSAPHGFPEGVSVVVGKTSVKVDGSTLLDLWKATDIAVQAGDPYHPFIESFKLKGDKVHVFLGS